MKKLSIIALFLISAVNAFCQVSGVPRKLTGIDPATSMPKYYLDTPKNLNTQHPIKMINDSTVGMDSGRYYITSILKNTSRDSTIFLFADNTRFAVKDSSGGGGGTGWTLIGNAGTTAGTNFIGTTDDQNVIFKRFGIQSGKIDSSNAANGITLFGFGAGRNNTAVDLTALGWNAAKSNTTGLSNMAIGLSALNSNVTGSDNLAIGKYAMLNNTGSHNTGIGEQALQANTSSGGSVAVGEQALLANTGGQNTAVGYLASSAATSGTGITTEGYSAGQNATGSYNTAIGWSALQPSSTGQLNTAIGYRGMFSYTGTGAGGNTVIGGQAGYNFTTGTYNTRIGSEWNFNTGITTGSKNTIIGANYLSPSSSLSNNIILTDGDGQVRYLSNSSAQSGPFNINPTSRWHLPPGSLAAGTTPLKFSYYNLTTTAASGTGGTVTLTYATTTTPAFSPAQTIVVAGITPLGYNGTYTVTASTATTVSYANSTTGAQTVAGTVTAGQLTTTPEDGAVEYDGTNFFGSVGAARYTIQKTITTGAALNLGTATLAAGTVTVSTTAALTGSKVFVTVVTPGGTQGFLSVPTIVNGTSFTITSTSATETSIVNWRIY